MNKLIFVIGLTLILYSCEEAGIDQEPIPCNVQYEYDISKITQDSTASRITPREADSLRQVAYQKAVFCAHGKI